MGPHYTSCDFWELCEQIQRRKKKERIGKEKNRKEQKRKEKKIRKERKKNKNKKNITTIPRCH